MKIKILSVLLCCITAWSGIYAQQYGKLAAGLEIFSTTGFGIELSTPLSPHLGLRGGISMFPKFNFDFTADGPTIEESLMNKIDEAIMSEPEIELALRQNGLPTRARGINTDIDASASLNFLNAKILADYYPSARRPFHFTFGLYIGNSRLIKANGGIEEGYRVLEVLNMFEYNYLDDPFSISDDGKYKISGRDIKNIDLAFKTQSVKPYLGFGFGRTVPKKAVGVRFDMGAYYMGTPKLSSSNINVQNTINDELEASDVADLLKYLSFYPVLSLKINFRLF